MKTVKTITFSYISETESSDGGVPQSKRHNLSIWLREATQAVGKREY